MRRFLADVLLFCGLVALLLLGVDLAYNLKLRSMRLDPQIATVICGDSHTETGLDDSVIPHSVNISQSAEHLLFTYEKLALILPRNPGIRTVVLGLSYHSFSAFNDDYTQRQSVSRVAYAASFPLLDYQRKLFLLSHDPVGVVKWSGAIVRRELAELVLAHRYADYAFWGHGYRSNRSNLSDSAVAAAIRLHYYRRDGEVQRLAAYQVPYLERIVRLCAEHHVSLILVNTPVSPQYAARVPRRFVYNYYATVNSVRADGVGFLDYHDLALPAESYGDADHLNVRGAAFLSRKVWAAMSGRHER